MIPVVVLSFIDIFVLCFNALLLARVILSWFMQPGANWFVTLLYELTEPLLDPVRRILPGSGGPVDWAPLVTFFLLQGLQYGAHYLFARL